MGRAKSFLLTHEQVQSIECVLEKFFKKYGLRHLEVSLTQVPNENAYHAERLFQYQVFTGSNKYRCEPGATIKEALKNAEKIIEDN